jgi:hypothetical protein
MKLWLVCFLILFFAAEGLQWLGQLPGLGQANLSQPLVVVAGLGLALASNAFPQRSSPKASRPRPPEAAPAGLQATGFQATEVPVVAAPPLASPAPKAAPGKSISFEIPRAQP